MNDQDDYWRCDRAARGTLADAATYIAENGHHKEGLFDLGMIDAEDAPPGDVLPACALGAIMQSKPVSFDSLNIELRAIKILADAVAAADSGRRTPAGQVAEWNDAPERTAEDVILTLKRLGHE